MKTIYYQIEFTRGDLGWWSNWERLKTDKEAKKAYKEKLIQAKTKGLKAIRLVKITLEHKTIHHNEI